MRTLWPFRGSTFDPATYGGALTAGTLAVSGTTTLGGGYVVITNDGAITLDDAVAIIYLNLAQTSGIGGDGAGGITFYFGGLQGGIDLNGNFALLGKATFTRGFVPTPSTVANLPPSPTAGQICTVNNALAPVYGAAVAGGGAVTTIVMWNGANWIVH